MDIPAHSLLFDEAKGACFADSFSCELAYTQQTALDIYLYIATNMPA